MGRVHCKLQRPCLWVVFTERWFKEWGVQIPVYLQPLKWL